MRKKASSFDPVSVDQLPASLPLFAWRQGLLLPRGRLPLTVHEPQHLRLVQNALATPDRMIGIVQPQNASHSSPTFYPVGCAGRLCHFSETDDGQYQIVLAGTCRFRIVSTRKTPHGYSTAKTDWEPFTNDLMPIVGDIVKRSIFIPDLKKFFMLHDLSLDWEAIDSVSDENLVNSLCMACPFDLRERQALLEAPTLAERARLLCAMIEMSILETRRQENDDTHVRH